MKRRQQEASILKWKKNNKKTRFFINAARRSVLRAASYLYGRYVKNNYNDYADFVHTGTLP